MKWEEQETDDDTEFWIVGENKSGNIWTFMADVFIDKDNNSSEVEFDVFTLPRHIVEDSGWKTLRDGVKDLKSIVSEMERIDKVAKEMKLEIFSDEFVGFKTCYTIDSADKKEIEAKIKELRKALGV